MSTNQTEVVDESKMEVPKDDRPLRYARLVSLLNEWAKEDPGFDNRVLALLEADASSRHTPPTSMEVGEVKTPPPGHIIDESGTVRKVLGTLPITGCGSVLGWGVFNMWRIVGNRREVVGPFHEEMGPNGWASQHGLPDKFYSTEQAAREAGGKA